VKPDRDRGRAVAAALKKLGVMKGPLIRAAEEGFITELACKMPECFCPEELGGRTHFEPVLSDWGDWRSDWMPTHEHFPIPKRDGGRRTPDKSPRRGDPPRRKFVGVVGRCPPPRGQRHTVAVP
jgi:hypothetical protein